jgi:hypothetical protein
MVLLSLYGYIKRNYGIIFFAYLTTSFKVNLLSDSGISGTYFEPQYIIGLIWLLAVWTSAVHDKNKAIQKLEKNILVFVFLYSITPIFESLKGYILFNKELFTSKVVIKIVIDFLVFYTFINFNKVRTIPINYIKNGIVLGTLIIAGQFLLNPSDLDIGTTLIKTAQGERFGGIMKANLNDIAFILVIPAYYIIILFGNRKLNWLTSILSLLLILYGISMTGSRSGVFGFFLAMILFLFSPDLNNKILFNKKRIIYIGLFIFILIIAYYLIPIFGQTFMKRLQSESLDNNVRVLRYPEYLSFFFGNPLYLFTGALTEITGRYSKNYAAHNFFIQRIYSFGVLYLFIYIVLLWRIATSRNKFLKYPVIIFLIYGITGSDPPLAYFPYILLFFNQYFINKANHVNECLDTTLALIPKTKK